MMWPCEATMFSLVVFAELMGHRMSVDYQQHLA